jgi:hypothetical protein
MRSKLIAAGAIALGTAALLTTPAQAATADECQGLIAALSTDTAGALSLSEKSRTGLVSKADDAAVKLEEGKVADALAKLTDVDVTLEALHVAPKPKVSDDDFALLNADTEAALSCVAGLATP